MRKLLYASCMTLVMWLPDPVHSQFYCAEATFMNSCVYCDGILFTGAAYETSLGRCVACFNECPSEIEPEGVVDSSPSSSEASSRLCGLAWDEFAAEARLAEERGVEPKARYIHVSVGKDLSRMLARRAPLIADYLLMNDGYIRLDFSDESLTSINEDPVMLSGHEATTEMANWLIDHRHEILTEVGRNSLDPPLGRRLEKGERQAVYTNVERIGTDAALATVRATWFRLDGRQDTEPEVLKQQILELELETGSTKRISDNMRAVLGDPRPSQRLVAEIVDYSLHIDE